jgi:hypothetical protein
MNCFLHRSALAALFIVACAGSALAQTAPGQTRPDMRGPGMGPGWDAGPHAPMRGMMGMMSFGQVEHVEGRIAFLKAELKITEAQQKLFDALAAALRENAKQMNALTADITPETMAEWNTEKRLAWKEKALSAWLEVVKRTRAAVGPLYAALNDEQKAEFDDHALGPEDWAGWRRGPRWRRRMQ